MTKAYELTKTGSTSCHILSIREITIVFFLGMQFLVPSIGLASESILSMKYTAPQDLVIGSTNTATADPQLPRPDTDPCTVELFSDIVFPSDNPSSHTFDYAPPMACPGPWEKVIFEGDFSVSAGVQFDRTASVWIAGTNIYFGTTAEPTPNSGFGRDWHVESDLTDYSPLFRNEETGQVILPNSINETLTSPISASGRLVFYPTKEGSNPPEAADVVLALSKDSDGGVVSLRPSSNLLARTFQLPTNIERAYLDVFAQGQTTQDEFWYTCVPDDLADELQSCPSTAFRETQVSIDGQTAGVAPIFPWIFTGGTNPLMWRPIPGVETLNFAPYRVNLAPFAGILSDGEPHEVAISVFNVNAFSVTATLLLYLDEGSSQVTGGVIKNTIDAPNPIIDANVDSIDGVVNATVSVRSNRAFELIGFVNTSHGRVETTITQEINFSNHQNIIIDGSEMVQDVDQMTMISSETTTQNADKEPQVVSLNRIWPLQQNNLQIIFPDGTITRDTSVHQERQETLEIKPSNQLTTFKNLVMPEAFALNPHQAISEGVGESVQQYFVNSNTTSFGRTIRASLEKLDSVNNNGEGTRTSCSISSKGSSSILPFFVFIISVLLIPIAVRNILR